MNSRDINEAIRNATGIQRDDFDSDLNAMNKAEITLGMSAKIYVSELASVTRGDMLKWDFNCVCATPRQRAEAFLRVKGLFKE